MGIAFLPDGRRMSYEEYLKTPEWRMKKTNRLAFDNWQCGICHTLLDANYETHHLTYARLGNENIEKDLISICRSCHASFHNAWEKSDKWESSPHTHWKDYSLPDTALFCFEYLQDDILFGGKVNLCSLDTIDAYIDRYFTEHEVENPVRIAEEDIRLFVRNKRYELFFDANNNEGFELESWLDSRYGAKGGKGGNPIRAEARRFFTKHKIVAMRRIYKESENANILMKEVRNLCRNQTIMQKHQQENTPQSNWVDTLRW